MKSFFLEKILLKGSTMYTNYFETIVNNYKKISTLAPNNFV